MRHFSVYGKTWKIVSQNMCDNGIKDKDQLQCRTHGQKYLLSLEEIRKTIAEGDSELCKSFDKKIYQKLQRYEDDKRYLYQLFLQDQITNPAKGQIHLEFQSEVAKQ